MNPRGCGGDYARKRIETSDGAMGHMGGCSPYAEGFIPMRPQLHRHLPVTDATLEVAASSDHEVMHRSTCRIPVD